MNEAERVIVGEILPSLCIKVKGERGGGEGERERGGEELNTSQMSYALLAEKEERGKKSEGKGVYLLIYSFVDNLTTR